MRELVRPEFVYLDMGNVIVSFDRDRAFRQMAAVCGATPEAIRDAVMTWCSRDLHCGLYVIVSDRQSAEQLAISIEAELIDLQVPAPELAARLAQRSRATLPAWHWP